MYIKSIHIESFGMLNDFDLDLSKGLNVIEGKNESGKSTLSSFIKFIFYGLSAKKDDSGITERQKYISWKTGKAAGSLTLVSDREYVIEREVFSFGDQTSKLTEKVKIYDRETLEIIKREGAEPGEIFFGMPEEIFENTSYVGQLVDARINAVGLSEAIENMLMSGDENVNAQKALAKLEKLRTSLRYTKGQGGKLFELEREKARLEENLSEAKIKAADVIELETAVFEIETAIKAKEAAYKDYGDVIDAYKKIQAERRLSEVRRYAAEIDRIDEKISEYNKYGNITDKEIEIQKLSAAIDNIDDRLFTLRSKMSELETSIPKMDEEDIKKARAEVIEAEECAAKKGGKMAVGVIFLILMVACIAATLYIPTLYPKIFESPIMFNTIGMVCAGICAIIGALSITGSVKRSNRLKAILENWEVESEAKLEGRVENAIRISKTREDPSSEYCATASSLEKTKQERIETNTRLTELCTLFCDPDDDYTVMSANATAVAERYAAELGTLKETRKELFGKYSVLSYVIGDDGGESIDKAYEQVIDTEAGRKAEKMTEADFAECEKQYGFIEATLPKLREQRSDKNSKLAIIRAATVEPSVVSAQLDSVVSEYESATKQLAAVILSIETIKQAQNNIRQSFLPRVSSKSGKMLCNFSGGKYDSVSLDNSFSVNYENNGRVNNTALLSCGTKDIVYVAVRLSLLDVLFGEKIPPCIYDESFARVDEDRLSSVIDILSAGIVQQSILFTCRSLEGEIAEKTGNANVIRLNTVNE